MGLEEFEKCNTCLKETCSYKPDDLECIEEYDPCMFCLRHTYETELYQLTNFNNDYTFKRITNVRYCPCCGRPLNNINKFIF